MTEQELSDYGRLRVEGRWELANEFREAERRRLRAEGKPKDVAKDESWALMLAKFPPPGQRNHEPTGPDDRNLEEVNDSIWIEHSDGERSELAGLVQDAGAWDDNLSDALRWASSYATLDVTPAKAPSVLAWMLRQLCRADRELFTALCFADFCRRWGHSILMPNSHDARECFLYDLMRFELDHDGTIAELIAADRRNSKSPTIVEAMQAADTEEDAERIFEQAVRAQQRNQISSASKASKS